MFKFVKSTFAFIFGLPLALVASGFSFAASAALKTTSFFMSKVYEFLGLKLDSNNVLERTADTLLSSIPKIWTNFGIYGHKEAAKFISESASKASSYINAEKGSATTGKKSNEAEANGKPRSEVQNPMAKPVQGKREAILHQ